jgi:hypothetical protein
MQSVRELFSWSSLNSTVYTEGNEELRLWLGGGAAWPGMVIRIRKSPGDSGIAQLVTWWQKGDFAEFIRESVERDPGMGCGKILHGKDVEGCIVSLPSDRSYAAILPGEYGDSLRSVVFAPGLRVPAGGDSVGIAVEYRQGEHFGVATPLATDSLNPLTRPAFCIFKKATDSGRPKVYADPFEC